MALSPNQKEEAYIQAFIKTLKDLAKNGDQLNGVQLKGVEGMTKWMTQMSNTNTVTKANLKIAKDQNTLAKKQQQLDLVKKKMDEVNIRLRHGYKLQEEKEHGEQVRRNIQLRQMHENFTAGYNHLKKALFGGFGFQAAIGTTVKKMAGMTRNFNELQVANAKLKDSSDKVNKATGKSLAAYNMPDWREDKDQKIKHADMELNFAMQDKVRAQTGVDTAKDMAKGTQGKMKPIFEKLGKLGEFLGKKAVPIGIGIGVAGILMSVIVKAFSASPLFGAMMKLMKFMVQLILMPIGTFFGALLRPILIMLLRKFIIPFYSQAMPAWMALGTQLGDWMVTLTPAGIAAALKELLQPTNPATLDEIEKNEEIRETTNQAVLDEFSNDPLGFIWKLFNLPTVDNVLPPSTAAEQEKTEEDIFVPKEDPLHSDNLPTGDPNDTRTFEEKFNDGLKDLVPTGGTLSFDKSSSSSTNNNTWGNGEGLPEYVNPVTPKTTELTENQKDMQLMMNDPQAWQAKQDKIKADKKKAQQEKWMLEAEEKALKQKQQEENQKRISESLKKPNIRNIDQVIADQAARNAQQETVNTSNPRFAGTPSEEKLSRSLNAGANVGEAMKKNASRGHTMGSSKAGSDILREYWASRGVTMAAEGFDGMVNSPTMFMAGEAGAEHVKVTPSGQGGGGNITVNIQNMNGSDDDLRKLKKTILEVIQQSANNRGRI